MNPLIADIANKLGMSKQYMDNQPIIDSVANTLEQSGAQKQEAMDQMKFNNTLSPDNINKVITQRKQGVVDSGIVAGGGGRQE